MFTLTSPLLSMPKEIAFWQWITGNNCSLAVWRVGIIAKTSERPYIAFETFSVLVCLSVCVWHDSGCKIYPIRVKCGTDVCYAKSDVYCMSEHYPKRAYIGIHKSFSIHYGLWTKMCLYSFLPVQGPTAVGEIIRFP